MIALTYADNLSVPTAEKKKADFKMNEFFDRRVKEWQSRIIETLVDDVGIQRVRAEKVVVRPTTDGPDDNLPNGQEWYHPLWVTILKLLPHGAAMQFTKMRAKKISGKDNIAEVVKTVAEKIAEYAIVGGALGYITGGVFGSVWPLEQ